MKFFLTLIALGVILLVRGCDGEIRNFDISQYEKAKVVGTLRNTKEIIHIKTATGVNVNLFLPSVNSISLVFQGDKQERVIYHTYFIRSAEARQSGVSDLLFVKIDGAYIDRRNEWYNEKKVFVYDLSTRKLIGWARVS